MDAADQIARTPQVARLVFGHLDFQLDLGMRASPEQAELASARFTLVAASRRAALAAPVDGVTTDIANAQMLHEDLVRARALGFGAKLCIHPAQVNDVNHAFSPTADEIDWARQVLEGTRKHGGAAFSQEGAWSTFGSSVMEPVPVASCCSTKLRRRSRNATQLGRF